eukprot:215687-Rhodomonas_salina.1
MRPSRVGPPLRSIMRDPPIPRVATRRVYADGTLTSPSPKPLLSPSVGLQELESTPGVAFCPRCDPSIHQVPLAPLEECARWLLAYVPGGEGRVGEAGAGPASVSQPGSDRLLQVWRPLQLRAHPRGDPRHSDRAGEAWSILDLRYMCVVGREGSDQSIPFVSCYCCPRRRRCGW